MNIRLNMYNDHRADQQVNFTHETKELFDSYVFNNLENVIQTMFPYQQNIETTICLFANYSVSGLITRYSMEMEMVHNLIAVYTIREGFQVITAATTRDEAIRKLSHFIWDRANVLQDQMKGSVSNEQNIVA